MRRARRIQTRTPYILDIMYGVCTHGAKFNPTQWNMPKDESPIKQVTVRWKGCVHLRVRVHEGKVTSLYVRKIDKSTQNRRFSRLMRQHRRYLRR